ncbi:hypothetical protein BJ978_001413 [Agromyces terreus]|uniref:Uncharacterized protein n=1 Tax=Agromyces terreus TaxID=424795 RepID=A0A9X2KEK8_9MICO|nr:hypothetical protein [Agromyces terreus]MCP2370737.1 hypothetical protein [Agromyces terreus]
MELSGSLWDLTPLKAIGLASISVFAIAVGVVVATQRSRIRARWADAWGSGTALPTLAVVFGATLFLLVGFGIAAFLVVLVVLNG